MKYANYKFYARGINNLGDNMQLIAIDYIYGCMGIPEKDIIYIDKNELSSYDGEYVVLPVTMPLVDYVEDGMCGRFSDKIIPVFLGLTLVKDSLLPREIEYYRRFEPVGCRDERTMYILRKNGIQAYLHGCITATLPRRNIDKKSFDKVFIVDVVPELIPYIPRELKENAEFLTHMHEDIDDPKELMQQYYDRYKNEAMLIITGLLHCTVPCMAAGIPVIAARKQISFRFGWLEKLMPLYDRDDFGDIDWNPSPIAYEDMKEKIVHITIQRLQETYNKYNRICDLSWFYEQREKKEYVIDVFESIRKYVDRHFSGKHNDIKYSIWGLTQVSLLISDYISNNYPNAKLMHVYDTYRRVRFNGLQSESPQGIRNYPDEIVLVTTNGARRMAQSLFDEIDKKNDTYVFPEVLG